MKRICSLLFTIYLMLVLTACGGSNSSSSSYGGSSSNESAPAAAPAAMAPQESYAMDSATGGEIEMKMYESGSSQESGSRQNKIIFTGNIYMETNQFDSVLDSIQNMLEEKGGYVSSSNVYNYRQLQSKDYRTYNVTLKVPVETYKETFSYLKTLGKLLSSDETASDVTEEYYDIESRLSTKKIEEERVLDMISRAEKIEDLIALEKRLGELRTDIEIYEANLRNLNRLTTYSTINMTVHEIDEGEILAVSEDLGDRIRKGFAMSVNGTISFFETVIVFLAAISIPLVVILLLALAVFLIHRAGRRGTRQDIKRD